MPQSHFGIQPQHIHILALTALIASVGFLDFLIFWHLSDILIELFFGGITGTRAHWIGVLAIFAIGYIARPVGGYFLGRYADAKGRKPALFLSLSIFSLSTLTIGLLPTYQDIGMTAGVLFVLARIGQGFGFGPTMPLIWIYLAELLPNRQVGLGLGISCGACTLGMLFAHVAALTVIDSLSNTELISSGWRIPFLLGGLLGLALWLWHKKFAETPVFLLSSQDNDKEHHLELFDIITTRISKSLQSFSSILILSWFVASVVVFTVLILPLLEIGFVKDVSDYLTIGHLMGVVLFAIGCVFFGLMGDRHNIAIVMIVGCIALVMSTWSFFTDLMDGGQMVLFFFALLGFSSGVVATAPILMVRLCPPRQRGVVILTGYNFVNALVGVIMPLSISYATYHLTLAPALYLTVVCVLTIFFAFLMYYVPKTDKPEEPQEQKP